MLFLENNHDVSGWIISLNDVIQKGFRDIILCTFQSTNRTKDLTYNQTLFRYVD